MGHPGLFLIYFRLFQTNNTILTTNQCEKCHVHPGIWRRDSNPQPSECESTPIANRQGLPPCSCLLRKIKRKHMSTESLHSQSPKFVVTMSRVIFYKKSVTQFVFTQTVRDCKRQHFTFYKRAKPDIFLFIFSYLSQHNDKFAQNWTINGNSVDGALGIWTQDHSMVGTEESTELRS